MSLPQPDNNDLKIAAVLGEEQDSQTVEKEQTFYTKIELMATFLVYLQVQPSEFYKLHDDEVNAIVKEWQRSVRTRTRN